MSQQRFNPAQYPLAYTLPNSLGDAGAWAEHIPFGCALVDMLRPKAVVELGSQWGDSYFALCQAAKALELGERGTKCFSVDTWQGDAQTGMYDENIYNFVVQANAPYASFSTLKRMRFDDALGSFEDGSIDLLHIDGLHTYEAVSHDFHTWLPKASKRGVVLFHDTMERVADFGVWKLWEEIAGKWPSFEFPFGHGLGVLAVGAEVPEAVREFLEVAKTEREAVVRHFGSLGRGVLTTSVYLMLARRALHAQGIVNQWRQATGQQVDPRSQSLEQGAMMIGDRTIHEITNLANSDMALRQRLAQVGGMGGATPGVMRM